MRLIQRSRHHPDFVRAVSPAGDWFVGSLVACMLLVSLGDALDPALFGEAGLEFGLFDLGGEFSVLAARHWHLLQLLLAGGLLVAGVAWLRVCSRMAFKVLRSAPGEGVDKVPI
jgi:hypothetical protein